MVCETVCTPQEGEVIATEYVPGFVAVMLCEVCPPGVHVLPLAAEDVKVTDSPAHISVGPEMVYTGGGVMVIVVVAGVPGPPHAVDGVTVIV